VHDRCGRFHEGSDAPATAESLMRSRYSAFAVRDAAYLLRSWHLRTRPHRVEFDPQQRWLRLEVVDTADGGLFDRQGTVDFVPTTSVAGDAAACTNAAASPAMRADGLCGR
jgi:SEC-C motif-containing protein